MKKKIVAIIGVVLVAVMLTAVLVACVPTDPAKAESNLKSADYNVEKAQGIGAALMVGTVNAMTKTEVDLTKVDSVVFGGKGSDWVTIFYFKDSDSAKQYYDGITPALEKLKEEADKNNKEFNTDYGRNGVAVYLGTTAGVKAAK